MIVGTLRVRLLLRQARSLKDKRQVVKSIKDRLRNAFNVPGGTNSSYTLSPAALGDNGAQFRCYIVNPQGNTNSSTAILTVQADTTPPTISSVGNLGDNTIVTVLFSEPVEAATGIRPPLPERLADLLDRAERYELLPNDLAAVETFVRNAIA